MLWCSFSVKGAGERHWKWVVMTLLQVGYLLCLLTLSLIFSLKLSPSVSLDHPLCLMIKEMCVCVCVCVCRMKKGERRREGTKAWWPGPRNKAEACSAIFLWPFKQDPCWNFWILSSGVQVHSIGQPVTIPQRCECPRVSQAQYFTLWVRNDFNSSFHHPTPTHIKKLLDPQRALAQPGLKMPTKAAKRPAVNILL